MDSTKNEIMLIGEKESFLIRVLLKKLAEANLKAFFVPAKITNIDAAFRRASVLTYYLDNSEHVKPDLMHYLADKLTETDKKIAFIGEKSDAEETVGYLPSDLILKTFLRPLDTSDYISTMSAHMNRLTSAERKKSILIVDDDPSYMGLIREWIKGTYKVSMANSGLQAIKWLGMNTADLILLDYEMPVTSGPQVLEMLRSDPETASIPVFFLTGKSDKNSVMQVMSLKPQNYLLKTIEKEELLHNLDQFFSKKN